MLRKPTVQVNFERPGSIHVFALMGALPWDQLASELIPLFSEERNYPSPTEEISASVLNTPRFCPRPLPKRCMG